MPEVLCLTDYTNQIRILYILSDKDLLDWRVWRDSDWLLNNCTIIWLCFRTSPSECSSMRTDCQDLHTTLCRALAKSVPVQIWHFFAFANWWRSKFRTSGRVLRNSCSLTFAGTSALYSHLIIHASRPNEAKSEHQEPEVSNLQESDTQKLIRIGCLASSSAKKVSKNLKNERGSRLVTHNVFMKTYNLLTS